jgi:dTDP-glucose pyrophosphorylase
MTVIITMAGRGQRFRDRGFAVPKYEIVTRGKSLFEWSMMSLQAFLPVAENVIYLTREEDKAAPFLARASADLGIARHAVIELDAVTDGQARTAALAAPAVVDPGAPMLVYNIDTHVRPGAMRPDQARGDGWIPCFPGLGEGWSFARVDGQNRVMEMREKKRISNHATVGLYWFSSFSLYQELFESFYADSKNEERGEKYIAPMYNQLIGQGREVFIDALPLDAIIPLGTPDEVAAFEAASTSETGGKGDHG